jgi:hypothetical protein
MIFPLIKELGVFAVIGAFLGWFFFGTSNSNGKNVLGGDPADPWVAATVGALVIGVLGWFIVGFIIGSSI